MKHDFAEALMPTPVCDTTPWPSADTFTRETAALLFT